MSVLESVPVGATATTTLQVTHDLTVAAHVEGLPAVFATPMMIYLMEKAAVEALAPYLPEGWVSVGVVVNVKHLAATPVGFEVTATAEVIEVSGRTVTFKVEAHDGVEKIGEGTHVRAPVEMARFEKGFQAKLAKRP